MKVYIINDQEVDNLVDRITIKRFQSLEDGNNKQLVEDIHRRFVYEIVSWIQDVVKK